MDLWQEFSNRVLQYSERYRDSLEILSSSLGVNIDGPHPAIVDDGGLDKRDEEMHTLVDDSLVQTSDTVHDECLYVS
jgi:hypothetical protein